MAILTIPSELSQGATTAVSDLAINVPGSGADADFASTAELPTVANDEFFEVRDHSNTQNNGLWRVVVFTSTSAFTADKVSGSAPIDADTPEAATLLGTTATAKNIFYDTAGLGIYLLEQNGLGAEGVTGQAIYSHAKDTWKDDSFIIANAPFPLVTIDADAGKFEIGTDGTNNNGFTWVDDVAGFGIRTRKLVRNAGWNERDASGNITDRYFGAITLGAFEDLTGDTAYYQYGTDTTVNDTVDFDFAGPVNEAVLFFTELGNPTGLDFTGATSLLRTSGDFIADGYKVGGQITIRSSGNPGTNDGTWTILAVTALDIEVTGSTWTTGADGTAILAVDNGNAITLRLRVRDTDPNGKTFAQANLASAGRTVLSNFVYAFPLANATDLDISATDITITGTTPWSGMSITYASTPQARAGLVGGSFNFGIIIDGNNGTSQEVYEFVQYSLRQTTDIDDDASIAIGRTMDGLMRFVGAQLQVGSADGGLTFPTNPDGGGSGVYIDNLNAASANDVIFYDNTGVARANPETIAVTLDFNSTIIDDTLSEFDLFYDRTIQTNVTDFTITIGGIDIINGTLPTNDEIVIGKYVRVVGLTGGDIPMNGVYQITAITGGTNWYVVRYDGAAIVAVTTATVDIDQNCIDTPDAIIVHTNVVTEGADIDYTTPNTINSQSTNLSIFSIGEIIEISGSTSNEGFHTISGVTASQLLVEGTITTEASGTTNSLSQIVSGLASIDFTFSYDFDGNTQGGRTVSTTTFVKAKAIGQSGSQYSESTVQQIVTGTPLTIPLVGQVERNYSS